MLTQSTVGATAKEKKVGCFMRRICSVLCASSSLKLNSSHLKMDGWNASFLLGDTIFKGYVSFREGVS